MAKEPVQKELVSISHLDKWYRNASLEFHALKDVSMTVNYGDFTAIVGPSGSGKSTLMNVIGCLDRYDSGDYLLAGQEVDKLDDKELAKFRGKVIGFVFQSFNLLDRYTVLENILLPSFYVKVENAQERAMEILDMLGIADKADNYISQISGGQKQRVAIARALLGDPDLLLADEPTGNLDSKTGKMVLEIFQKLNDMGKTIILITHDDHIAEQAKKQIKILDGKIA